MTLYPSICKYVEARINEFDRIDAERRDLLVEFSRYIREESLTGDPIQLTFICTHNSRRSHFAQIQAQTAAAYYDIPKVEAYSGGTEATAFNPRAVAALQRAGFQITATTNSENPIYHVHYAEHAEPVVGFSKVYHAAPNPKQNFCAVMTCSSADQACPSVYGAKKRIAIPYRDPKEADDTPEAEAVYDERCKQIGREMLYVFSMVRP